MMNVWKISVKNTLSKPLDVLLTVLFLGVSIALLLGVEELNESFKNKFNNNLGGVDLVIGAKGSSLQLVMASLLHLDSPTGNIPYEEALKISRNKLVKKAIPISYGDNYLGYRIVGTTNDFPEIYNATIAEGRAPEKAFEVAIGAVLAEKEHLHIGDTFKSTHGLVSDGHVHNKVMTIVGIYTKTNQVLDKLLVTPLESVWRMHEHHDEEHHDDDKPKEVTALLVKFRTPIGLLTFPRKINESTNMQAALPKYEMEKLFNFIGVGVTTVNWIAYLILGLSCLGLGINFLKLVKERAYDLALLRTYGARISELIRIILYEGLIITGVAIIIGLLLSQLIVYCIPHVLNIEVFQDLTLFIPYISFVKVIGLLLGILVVTVFIAIIPITKMKISKVLNDEV
ncbi:hypothetical protein NBRC110019_27040 [Neptunitalea chrysea]|uniref:ABC transport system permease protein n=1 Tax=Neptunitalea chrysea TaxID=1647581 RepID=A0A9W6EWU4_9FLAO|nr:FtsX-like permease family protein [Neptunitalea chrysea]GLB53663.1 hypothetical protein NBRC110019_27040 [Neptunitalea chrysea]